MNGHNIIVYEPKKGLHKNCLPTEDTIHTSIHPCVKNMVNNTRTNKDEL